MRMGGALVASAQCCGALRSSHARKLPTEKAESAGKKEKADAMHDREHKARAQSVNPAQPRVAIAPG
jgi:hypothetical protein